MKMPEVSLLEWQKRFGTEHSCEKIFEWYFPWCIYYISSGIPG